VFAIILIMLVGVGGGKVRFASARSSPGGRYRPSTRSNLESVSPVRLEATKTS
jgi:hypothetical protein